MFHRILLAGLLGATVCSGVVGCAGIGPKNERAMGEVRMSNSPTEIEVRPGWDIYEPGPDKFGYRYGPSIIVNDDGSLDMWLASIGGPDKDGMKQWDWIRYRHSDDGGKTWTAEQVVLKPTEGSRDRMSVCDPSVIRFGGYYYLGVTAVDNKPGKCNEVFVARSKSPAGPFEKWNGCGWGGDPAPMIPFREHADVWGAGEPSFVLKDHTLFIYYTVISRDEGGKEINETRVATAPADDSDWPGKLTLHGIAFSRVHGEDSADVKYVDQAGRFIAIAAAMRFKDDSHIVLRDSADGLHFAEPVGIRKNIQPRCHNAGISGTAEGHLDLNQNNVIAYAYSRNPGQKWGNWQTHLNPVVVRLAHAGDKKAIAAPAPKAGARKDENTMTLGEYRMGKLIYENPLAEEADVKGFRLEGKAAVAFPNGRLRLDSTVPPGGLESNIVYWCPEELPSDVAISWDFWPIREPGLCMLFFAARGKKGEDVFDPSLALREGRYGQYNKGDINAFHVSYFRRGLKVTDGLFTCNLRKSYGNHMVAQGGDPIPTAGAVQAVPPYRITVIKCGSEVAFFIKNVPIFKWTDDGRTYGPLLGGGKIGFRQMSPMVGEYANLKVHAVEKVAGGANVLPDRE